MKKNAKWLTALAVAGTVIGLIIAYFCKKKNETSEFDEDDFEDDFDLDGDLKPVSEREYVPLNKAADLAAHKADTESDESSEKEEDAGAEPAGDEQKEEESAAKDTAVSADEEASSDKEE